MSQQQILIQSLKALFGAFAAEPTDDVLRGYVLGVGDLEPEKLQAAVFKAIRECEHLPRPVELRKFAGEHSTEDGLAIAAWGDVQRAVSLGPWKAVDFADCRINAVLRLLGGWPAVVERFACAEEEKWLRIEFVKTYQAIGNRIGSEQCRPLMGLSEKQVVNGNIVDPVPVRIGCDPIRLIAAADEMPVAMLNRA
jgi:hypothetical protein